MAPHRHLCSARLPARDHGSPASPRRRRPASRSCPFERAAASGTQSGHSPHPCSALEPSAGLPGPSAPSFVANVTLLFNLFFHHVGGRTAHGALGQWDTGSARSSPAMYVLCVCVAMPFDVRSRSGGGMSLHTGRVAHAARSSLGWVRSTAACPRVLLERTPPTAPRVWGEGPTAERGPKSARRG